MLTHRHLPDFNRLSILSATILLAYSLAQFIQHPGLTLSLQLPGLFISFPLNITTVSELLAAGITATGVDWLLREHPALGSHSTREHVLIPALTALVIGIPLSQLPLGLSWWGVFTLEGVILILVVVAEYIAIDAGDARYPAAAAALTAVSYSLFLILAIVLRTARVRLFLLLPGLVLAGFLVSLRTMHLRHQGEWKFWEAGVIALVLGQIAAGFHYWPLTPLSYGLAVLAPAYALASLIGALEDGEPLRQALIEPGAVLLVVWGAAIWFR